MAELAKPYELLELGDGQHVEFILDHLDEGDLTIVPRTSGYPKRIDAIRIHVDPASKETSPSYYDVTSTTLFPDLRSRLGTGAMKGRRFRLTKYGVGLSGRYSLQGPLQ